MTMLFNKKLTLVFLFLLLAASIESLAQESIKFITYGTGVQSKEGDDDYHEIFIIKVPENFRNKLYLRVFDIDCGGANDFQGNAPWNSKTLFTFSGGSETEPLNGIFVSEPDEAELLSGKVIKSEIYGESATTDNDWITFAGFLPSDGFLYEGFYYFRFLAEGKEGTNGNVYDIYISTSELLNTPAERVEILNYSPTVRLLKKDGIAALRFTIPEGVRSLKIEDFDAAGADLRLRTALRSDIAIKSSGDGVWAVNTVNLVKEEDGRGASLIFGQGGESPNDATFKVTGDNGQGMPVRCPIFPAVSNTVPKMSYTFDYVADCYSVVFDATASSDAEKDALSFKWSFGDGSFDQGNRVVHKYPGQQIYDAYVVVTDNSKSDFNSQIAFFKVKVNKPPVAIYQKSIVLSPGEEFTFDGAASYDEDDGLKSYLWDFGDASKREGKSVKYAYQRTGKFTARLSVTDNSTSPCNTSTTDFSVWVNIKPVAAAGEDQSSAPGQKVSFDGSRSRDDDGEITLYKWSFGDGSSAEGAKVNHVYKAPGTYTVTLTVTDNAGAKNSSESDQMIVVVNAVPVAVAGPDKIAAENETLLFDGSQSSDSDGFISEYLWDFGDGTKSKGVKAAHSYKKAGRYQVTLTVIDNSGTTSNTSSNTLTVIVNSRPVAVAGNDEVITRSEFQFDGTSSSDPDGKVLKYFWEFGDGKTSTEAAPKHFYEKPGVYKVRLTVTDDTKTINNSSVAEFELVVNAKPVADAGPDLLGAPGQLLRFDGSRSFDSDGAIAEYRWEFGDGNSANGAIAEHKFTAPGTYYARLTVKDNTQQSNAIDFDEVKITINEKPVANAGRDVVSAPGIEVVLDGLGSFDRDGKIASYLWTFSDQPDVYTGSTVKRSFPQPGIYTAVLEVKDNSNAINNNAFDTLVIRINSAPTARAGSNIFTCESKLIFDGGASTDPDGDPLIFTWNFGDGTKIESGARVIHEYMKGGSYPVILTVDDGLGLPNSVATSSIIVKINEPPVASAGEDITVCAGEVVRFNGSGSSDPEGGFLRYTWDFGDGTGADGINPTKIYKIGGSYLVRLKVEDDSGLPCNTTYVTKSVTVIESPVSYAGEDQIVCLNSVVRFDGSKSKDNDGVVNNYLWDFGDGSTGGGPNPTHIYTKSGIYTVRLTITGDLIGQCDNTHTDELTVQVFEAPIAEFTLPLIYPRDQELVLTTEGSNTFTDQMTGVKWDFGDGTISTEKTGRHTYTKEGKYTVTLTIYTNSTTECKSASIQKIIVINAPPVAEIGSDIYSGIGQEILFDAGRSKDADGSIVSYDWDFGDGNKARGVNARHKYTQGGTYTVSLTVKDNTALSNNTTTASIKAVINFTPEPSIISRDYVCAGEKVSFSAKSSKDADIDKLTYLWELGDGFTTSDEEFTHSYLLPGTYTITLVANDGKNFANSQNKTIKQIVVNNRPVADAGRDIVLCPGDKVLLDGSASYDPDRDKLTYQWYSGNNLIAEGVKAETVFNSAGVQRITLKITDDKGTICSEASDEVIVTVNSKPTASAVSKNMEVFTGGAHDQVLFDATPSSDADGDMLQFNWDFGGGIQLSGSKVYHYFDKPGTYKVILTVNDGKGTSCSTSSEEITVIVKNR